VAFPGFPLRKDIEAKHLNSSDERNFFLFYVTKEWMEATDFFNAEFENGRRDCLSTTMFE
jgi:hypothetical protein